MKKHGLPSSALFPNEFAVILRCQAQALNFPFSFLFFYFQWLFAFCT